MATPEELKITFKSKLRQSTLFTGLDDDFLDKLLEHCQYETWPRGHRPTDALLQEQFNIVMQGRIELSRINETTGKKIVLFLLGAGDGFDVVRLLDERPHPLVAQAIDDLHLLTLPMTTLRGWIQTTPALNHNFLRYITEQLRGMEDLASDLALHDTLKRLAHLILRHAEPCTGEDAQTTYHAPLLEGLHHEQLAAMIGTVRQVVNRHLQSFKAGGSLETPAGRVVIRELEALIRRADVHMQRLFEKTKTRRKRY